MNYLLIGGQTPILNNEIEKFIENYNKNPYILYIALASIKYEFSYNLFKSKINCPISLITTNDLLSDDYKDKFNKANILYLAGGNTLTLLKYLKEYDLIKYFKQMDLIVGISAGMIAIASYGMGDSDSFVDRGNYYNFKMIKGLGLLNITVCPHYQKDELVMFDDECQKYNLDSYCLEDDTAIYFEDNHFKKGMNELNFNIMSILYRWFYKRNVKKRMQYIEMMLERN